MSTLIDLLSTSGTKLTRYNISSSAIPVSLVIGLIALLVIGETHFVQEVIVLLLVLAAAGAMYLLYTTAIVLKTVAERLGPASMTQVTASQVADSKVSALSVALASNPSETQACTRCVELQKQLSGDQKLKSLGLIATGIAHELNTPIQYIGNNVAFVRDELLNVCGLLSEYQEVIDAPGVSKEAVQRIHELYRDSDPEYLISEIPSTLSQTVDGIEHITHIVKALREFSHPGGEDPVLADLNRLIRAATTLTRNEWKYVADLSLDLESSLPQLLCQPSDLAQVLVNLVVNSAHAIGAKNGGIPRGTIEISTRTSGRDIVLQVRDSGCGIPSNILHRIYDPFFTTKEVGKGTGQGLAISKHIIEVGHHGTLLVESEEGIGTTFTIVLPMGGHRANT